MRRGILVVLGSVVLVLLGLGLVQGTRLLPAAPRPRADVDVLHTALYVDVAARRATARITLAPGPAGGTLEVGDLEIASVQRDRRPLAFQREGERLHLALPATTAPVTVEIAYRYQRHDDVQGAGYSYTHLWPDYCGRLFPCHSHPADGLRFTLEVEGVPDGQRLVAPRRIDLDVPAYMIAWTWGELEAVPIGETRSGLSVRAFVPAAEVAAARAAMAPLPAALDFLEDTLGAYPFGEELGSVWVPWPEGTAWGGMEHHPFSHVRSDVFDVPGIHVHEAAHGWFGNAVRIACWEDLVLSEGVTSYLTGRALEAAGHPAAEDYWRDRRVYVTRADEQDALPVWTDACTATDPRDAVSITGQYGFGPLFFRALEHEVGRDRLDQVLRDFYAAYRGRAARLDDLLRQLERDAGFDARACAARMLRERELPPDALGCPTD